MWIGCAMLLFWFELQLGRSLAFLLSFSCVCGVHLLFQAAMASQMTTPPPSPDTQPTTGIDSSPRASESLLQAVFV